MRKKEKRKERKKEKERRKEGRREGWKEGRKEGRRYPRLFKLQPDTITIRVIRVLAYLPDPEGKHTHISTFLPCL